MARPPKCRPHHGRGAVAAFYFAKFIQDCGLAGLTSRGGPGALTKELKTLGVFDRKYGVL